MTAEGQQKGQVGVANPAGPVQEGLRSEGLVSQRLTSRGNIGSRQGRDVAPPAEGCSQLDELLQLLLISDPSTTRVKSRSLADVPQARISAPDPCSSSTCDG